MQKVTTVLTIIAVIVVAAGLVYTYRPAADVEKAVPSPQVEAAKDKPVDNTVPWPPQPTQEALNNQNSVTIKPIEQTVKATIETNFGAIDLELKGEQAPITVGNFVQLAQSDFYDNITFHRVIPGFMIQGGDPQGDGTGGPGYNFKDEINSDPIIRGTIAMANAGPNTNGSQFFIVTAEATPHLDGRHTNFGQVTDGMDVIDAIAAVERDSADKPLEPVIIQDIVIKNTGGEPEE